MKGKSTNRLIDFPWQKIILTLLLLTTVTTGGALLAEGYRVNVAVQSVASFDGIKLHGTLYSPDGEENRKYPAIIMGNVWGMPSELFAVQALRMASHGYVVFMYSARGFLGSEGYINIGGQNDVKDVSAIIDWLQANPSVDKDRIGAGGVSLGGGIALVAAAFDARIKAVVTMAGWTDIEHTLLDDSQTSPGVWGDLLILFAEMSAHIDDATQRLFFRLKNYDVPRDELRAWAAARSPINYIETYNARQLPIYIQHGIDDHLFKFSQVNDFYQKLHTPKKLDMDLGDHAMSTFTGIIGLANPEWDRTIAWFDLYLKGDRDTEYLLSDADFRGVVKGTWPQRHVAYNGDGQVERQNYELSAPHGIFSGSMRFQSDYRHADDESKTLSSSKIFTASAGIPVISPFIESLTGIPPLTFKAFMRPDKVATFETGVNLLGRTVQGIPNVDLWVAPSQQRTQLVAILFRVDLLGVAFPVSIGAATLHDAVPGEPVHVTFDMGFSSYFIPAGSHLMLAIDSYDPYFLPITNHPFNMTLLFGQDYPATVSVPYL